LFGPSEQSFSPFPDYSGPRSITPLLLESSGIASGGLMERNMKTLMTVLTLGALVTAFVPSASAQRAPGMTREQAIQECSALNRRQSHDPYGATGGVQYHYRACMADHGQPE
jgi:hypothetical protein